MICSNKYSSLPPIPNTANTTQTFVHQSYDPNSGSIAQRISTSMARSTFSTNDFESLLQEFFTKNSNPWTFSQITKAKPIVSTIIYFSVSVALFLVLSITFCIISCCNSNRCLRTHRPQSKVTCTCQILLVVFFLLGIADMIYIAYRIDQSRVVINNSIEQMSQQIYPKEISEHLQYVIRQLEVLDAYFIRNDSILINATRSIIVESLIEILKQKYFLDDFIRLIVNIAENIKDLVIILSQESVISPLCRQTFIDIEIKYENLINHLQKPFNKICTCADKLTTSFDQNILDAFSSTHIQIRQIIDKMNNTASNQLTSFSDIEHQVLYYVNIVGIVFLVLVIVFCAIPTCFFIIIGMCYACRSSDDESIDMGGNSVVFDSIDNLSNTPTIDDFSNKIHYFPYDDVQEYTLENSSQSESIRSSYDSSCVPFCIIRIVFGLLFIMLITIIVLTAAYYAVDLLVHGGCRTAHEDASFLAKFFIETVIVSNFIGNDNSQLNATAYLILDDCINQIPISENLFNSSWIFLRESVRDLMDSLSKQIFNIFIMSTGVVNVPTDVSLLELLASDASRPNTSATVKKINKDLSSINGLIQNITNSNATLPPRLVQSTTDKFQNYLQQIIESTIDACPLPMATFYKADIILCHKMGNSFNGLWLNVFFFMFLIIVGCCIFGICILRRMYHSSDPIKQTNIEALYF